MGKTFFNFSKTYRTRFNSIHVNIILYFLILLIICTISFGVFAYTSINRIKSEAKINATNVVGQMTLNLDTYFREISTSVRTITMNNTIISYFQEYDANDPYTNLENRNNILKILNSFIMQRNDIYGITIFNNEAFCSSRNDVDVGSDQSFLESIYSKTINKKETLFWDDSYYFNSDGNKMMSISLAVRDINLLDSKELGVAVADLNFSGIDSIIANYKSWDSSTYYLLDEQKDICYSTDETSIIRNLSNDSFNEIFNGSKGYFTQVIDGSNYLVTYSTSQVNGWKIVNLIRLIEMDKQLAELKTTIWIIIAAILISVIIISFFITRKITNPLRSFIGKLEVIGEGNFDERLPEENNCYEINILNKVFNQMMNKICRLIDEVYTVRIKQKEAEFEALQAKINPHFLCNTLQSITSLAVLEQNSDIERVSISLGNLLEYTVYEKEEMVQACKELDYIKNYIAIQNIRYSNSINISFEIDKEIEKLYILKLMLQPLVENALYHGLEKRSHDKQIIIKAKKENNVVLFEIEDNGTGMDINRLQEVRERLYHKENYGKSIGLINVHERIQLKFGTEHGVEIYSEYGYGTRVEIRIPAIADLGRE